MTHQGPSTKKTIRFHDGRARHNCLHLRPKDWGFHHDHLNLNPCMDAPDFTPKGATYALEDKEDIIITGSFCTRS